jgi:hypothetical protein
MTGLVYIVAVLNGVTLVSPEPVPTDKCETLRKYNQAIVWMCVEKEEDCGTVPGVKRCPDYPVTKRYARKR